MTLFYTETINIKEIPKYLPPDKVNYEITFSKGYSPIKGNLTEKLKIQSFSVKNTDITAFLHLKIGGVEIRKVQLGLNNSVKSKDISLKSTISKTCEKDNNTCNFDLKFNIYSISKQSNRAILLSLSEIEELAKKTKENSGYFIHRISGQVAKTSKETINFINDPSKINNEYIKKIMEIFKHTSNQSSEYSRLIYRDIMVELYEYFLKGSKDPDKVIKDISSIFGSNVEEVAHKEIYAFYHVYEALIRKTADSPGYDKIQHFSYSLGKRYTSTKIGTDSAQVLAEVYDLTWKGNPWEDTKSDMEANNLGENYGWNLYKKYHPVRATIRGN